MNWNALFDLVWLYPVVDNIHVVDNLLYLNQSCDRI